MASQVIMLEMYCLESVVYGHYVYKQTWSLVVGEQLPVDIEEDNANGPRAVAVRTCRVVVGHVPKACSLASSINEDLVNVCNTNASHAYTPIYSVVNFHIPIFAN